MARINVALEVRAALGDNGRWTATVPALNIKAHGRTQGEAEQAARIGAERFLAMLESGALVMTTRVKGPGVPGPATVAIVQDELLIETEAPTPLEGTPLPPRRDGGQEL